MLRRIVGFAILALAVGFGLKIVLGLFGLVVGFVMTTLWFAAVGYGCYLLLRLISPASANKVRDLIGGTAPPRTPAKLP